MGRLGWSPSEFWQATPHDLCAGFSGTPEQMRAWIEGEQILGLRKALDDFKG